MDKRIVISIFALLALMALGWLVFFGDSPLDTPAPQARKSIKKEADTPPPQPIAKEKKKPAPPIEKPQEPKRQFTITGVIVDSDGEGIEESEVWVHGELPAPRPFAEWRESEGLYWKLSPAGEPILTEENGRFAYTGKLSGRIFVTVLSYGYAAKREAFELDGDALDVEIKLADAGDMRVKVADKRRSYSGEEGQIALIPAAEFPENISFDPDDFLERCVAMLPEVQTLHRRHVGGIGEGDYVALFWIDNKLFEYSEEFRINAGKIRDVVIHLTTGKELFGKVIGRDGLPLANHDIWLQSTAMGTSKEVKGKTDGLGNYHLKDIPAGTLYFVMQLDIEERGNRPLADLKFQRAISIPNREALERDFDLSKSIGCTIRGRITVDGKPAFNSASMPTTARDPRGFDAKFTRQNMHIAQDGSFAWYDIMPGEATITFRGFYDPKGETRGLPLSHRVKVDIQEGQKEYLINLNLQAFSVSGTVELPEDHRTMRHMVWISQNGQYLKATVLGEEGRFTFANLTGGEYEFSIHVDGYAPVRVTRQINSNVHDLLLSVHQKEGSIRVVLAGLAGNEGYQEMPNPSLERYRGRKPMPPRAYVSIMKDGKRLQLPGRMRVSTPQLEKVGSEGVIKGLETATYSVSVRMSGYAPSVHEVHVLAGEETRLDVTLHRLGVMMVEIDSPKPLKTMEFKAHVVAPNGQERSFNFGRVVEKDGKWLLHLPAEVSGAHRITITMPGLKAKELELPAILSQWVKTKAALEAE